jgi:hypothetical protein
MKTSAFRSSNRKANHRLAAAALGAGVAAVIAIALTSISASARSTASRPSGPPCPYARPGVACPTYPPGYRPAPKGPAAAARAAARAAAIRYTGPTPTATPGSIGDLPTPFSSERYLANNSWANVDGSVGYSAWAGWVTADPSQGVVVVLTGPVNDPTQTGSYSLKAYLTPTADGAVTIVSASGMTLTLRAADGTIFVFNVTSGAYE